MVTKILLIFIISSNTYSQCSEDDKKNVAESLLSIQKTLNAKSPVCIKLEGKNLCKDIEEAKLDYNEAVARVILKEGIITLGADLDQSIQNISKLSHKKINESIEILNNFENNLYNVQGLNLALTPSEKGEFIFDDKQVVITQEQIAKKCQNLQNKFCREYDKRSSEQKDNILKTLSGFLTSYSEANYDRERDNLFRDFREYVKVKKDNQTIDFETYTQSQDVKNITKLKTLMMNYSKNKSSAIAKEIAQLIPELEKTSIPYGKEMGLSHAEFLEETKKDLLSNHYTQLMRATNHISSVSTVKENLEKTDTLLSETMNNLNTQLKSSFTNPLVQQMCSELDTESCYKEVQKVQHKSNPMAQSFKAIYEKSKHHEKHVSALKQSSECVASKDSREDKKLCIERVAKNNKIDISSPLQELYQDMKDKEYILQKLSEDESIVDLEEYRMQLINRLYTKGCLEEDSHSIRVESTCGNELNELRNHEILKLSHGAQDIILKYKLSKRAKLEIQEDEGVTDEIDANDTHSTRGLSSSQVQSDVQVTKKVKRRRQRTSKREVRIAKRRKRITQRAANSSLGGQAFISGLSSSISYHSPQLLSVFAQQQQTRAWAGQQRDYYNWYGDNAQRMADNYRRNQLYQNWGYSTYNPINSGAFNTGNPYVYYNGSSNLNQFTYGGSSLELSSSSSSPFDYQF